MREEISEPQHWRNSNQRNASRNASWSSRRRSQEHAELAAEAVDAAMTAAAMADSEMADSEMTGEVGCAETLNASNIINSLATQLDLLEKQRKQLQQLLVQAQAKS